jgi:hypothetical protein
MYWTLLGQVAGPILAGLIAFLAAEWRRVVKESERIGKMDADASMLASQFAELKRDVKEDRIESKKEIGRVCERIDGLALRIFEKMDVLIKGGYTCAQLGNISALQTQSTADSDRILRLEGRMRDVEIAAANSEELSKANSERLTDCNKITNDHGRRIGTLEQQRSVRRKPT